jgi:hypothetical protein
VPTLAPTQAPPPVTAVPILRVSPVAPRRHATPAPTVSRSPQPTAALTESLRNALGCLASAPEPFTEGGVYLKFCLRHDAVVQAQVFDLNGKLLWKSEKRRLGPGNQQLFYEGWVSGARLPAGAYLFQIDADYGHGQAESRQGQMHRARGKRR